MKIYQILLLLFLCSGFVLACGETSVCEPGGSCEEYTVRLCTCCDPGFIENCKQDRRDACATGNLTVSGTPQSCSENLSNWDQIVAAGQNPCDSFSEEELEENGILMIE